MRSATSNRIIFFFFLPRLKPFNIPISCQISVESEKIVIKLIFALQKH